MADRTSANLFAKFFTLLAKNPTDEHKAIARELWPLRKDYDFDDYQMGCDAALTTLGLIPKEDDCPPATDADGRRPSPTGQDW